MHGSTGQVEMYIDNLRNYASHGFVVVFPYIKSPKADKNPFTTNTDGTYILHGLSYARGAACEYDRPGPSIENHGSISKPIGSEQIFSSF